MIQKAINTISNKIPEMVLLTLFVVLQLNHIDIDLWNDEIYTLKKFVLVPITTTLTDYHVPNNHVFFNLINNIYLKILSVNTLDEGLGNPLVIRFLPFCYSIITFIFTYKIAKTHFGRQAGLLAIALLITTVPFYFFSLQVRGYSLSMALTMVLLHIYLKIIYQEINRKNIASIILVTALLIYTVPSNLFVLMGLLLFSGISVLLELKKHKGNIKNILKSSHFILLAALSVGIIGSILLYSPVLKSVLSNEYVDKLTPFNLEMMDFYLKSLGEGILSFRWALLPLFVIGIFMVKKVNSSASKITLLFFTLCITPLAFILFRGDTPPPRVFSALFPVYILFCSIGIISFITFFIKKNKYLYPVLGLLFIYVSITFIGELKKTTQRLAYDLTVGYRAQNLYYQYYSSHYQPLKDMNMFDSIYKTKKLPVVTYGCEDHGIPHFLERLDIPFTITNNYDSLAAISDSFYIVTNHPKKVTLQAGFKLDTLNQSLTYHNTLLYRKDYGAILETIAAIDSIRTISPNLPIIIESNTLDYFKGIETYENCLISNAENKELLLQFVNKTENILFINTTNTSPQLLLPLIDEGFNVSTKDNNTTYLLDKSQQATLEVLYQNGFEAKEEQKANHLYSNTEVFKGNYSEQLDQKHQYLTTFETKAGEFEKDIIITFWTNKPTTDDALVVIEIDNKEKKVWKGFSMDQASYPFGRWKKVVVHYTIPTHIKPDDGIKIYSWNNKGIVFSIDDFKISTGNLGELYQ